jgi:hypothetical protein
MLIVYLCICNQIIHVKSYAFCLIEVLDTETYALFIHNCGFNKELDISCVIDVYTFYCIEVVFTAHFAHGDRDSKISFSF